MRQFLIFCLSMTAAFSSFAQDPSETNMRNITRKFQTTMMECPERIWTDFDWQGKSVLFYQKGEGVSLLWNPDDQTFEDIPNSEVPRDAQYGVYGFFQFREKPTMSLASRAGDFSEPYIFSLGVHEMFHYQGQMGWGGRAGGRHTVYPQNAKPRFLRRMIFDNLKAYFVDGDVHGLSQAKYWFDRWATEFPKEVESATDGYEGSAEYVETMARGLSELSCGASDTELQGYLHDYVKTDFGGSVSGDRLALDSEGYEIGGLASLILRFQPDQELKVWNQKLTTGQTPLELLMETEMPREQVPPEGLEGHFQDKEDEVNAAWGEVIDADIANWSNGDYVRVLTSFRMVNGSFSPQFFAFSAELDLPLFPFAGEQVFLSTEAEGSDFLAKIGTVLFEERDNPCGEGPVTLIPVNVLGWTGSPETQVKELDSESLVGRLVGQEKLDSRGQRYFCTQ